MIFREREKKDCAVARLETCPMKTLQREYGFVTRFVKMFGGQLDTLLTCFTVDITQMAMVTQILKATAGLLAGR